MERWRERQGEREGDGERQGERDREITDLAVISLSGQFPR